MSLMKVNVPVGIVADTVAAVDVVDNARRVNTPGVDADVRARRFFSPVGTVDITDTEVDVDNARRGHAPLVVIVAREWRS